MRKLNTFGLPISCRLSPHSCWTFTKTPMFRLDMQVTRIISIGGCDVETMFPGHRGSSERDTANGDPLESWPPRRISSGSGRSWREPQAVSAAPTDRQPRQIRARRRARRNNPLFDNLPDGSRWMLLCNDVVGRRRQQNHPVFGHPKNLLPVNPNHPNVARTL